MDLFDIKFIYMDWDDSLNGKKVIAGDSLQLIRIQVNGGDAKVRHVTDNSENSERYPFMDEAGTTWGLVYYDPNYSCKVAYMQGKKIQYRSVNGNWYDALYPSWEDDVEYRVKPAMWTVSIEENGTVHIMPACEWNKRYGRQLIEGTKEKCKAYVTDNYHGAVCVEHVEQGQETPELHVKSKDYLVALSHIVNPPVVHVSPDSALPVTWEVVYRGIESSCIDYMVDNYCKKCEYYSSPNCSVFQCQGFKCKVKKRRMTNRELARWIAKGWGECLNNTIAFTVWNYLTENKDKIVSDGIKIRGWDETEWHEPEVEE